VNASAELLRAAGYDVEVLNSGCCGMAGAFGYESDHYDVSMQVGELVLLPEARKMNANGGQVAAVGTSCRSQIADGAGVEARHPILLVAQKMKVST
jgi:Fe-S oxidoreductase